MQRQQHRSCCTCSWRQQVSMWPPAAVVVAEAEPALLTWLTDCMWQLVYKDHGLGSSRSSGFAKFDICNNNTAAILLQSGPHALSSDAAAWLCKVLRLQPTL